MTDRLDRYECLEYLAETVTDELVVSWGTFTHEWVNVSNEREGNLTQSGMGCTIPLSIGLAKALPHRTVIGLVGDGDLLMALGALPSLGRENPDNLVIFVNDNESYLLSDDVPTMTAEGTDLEGFAEASGVEYTATIRDFEDFKRETTEALESSDGARFLVLKTTNEPLQSFAGVLSRQTLKYNFIRHIEETEDVEIFPTRRSA